MSNEECRQFNIRNPVDSLMVHRSNSKKSNSVRKLKNLKALKIDSLNVEAPSSILLKQPNEPIDIDPKILEHAKGVILSLDKNINTEIVEQVSKRYCNELLSIVKSKEESLDDITQSDLISLSPSEMPASQEIIKFCCISDHNFLPIFGNIFIVYFSLNNKLTNKTISRIVNFHTKGLQNQKSIAKNVVESIKDALKINDVGVKIETINLEFYKEQNDEADELITTYYIDGEMKNVIRCELEKSNTHLR